MRTPGLIIPLLFLFSSVSFSQSTDSLKLKDGVYAGISRAKYTGEPYWGIVRVTVVNGEFTEISFIIRDSLLHETFNAEYSKHFAGNELYIQQTRNDWNGVQVYPVRWMQNKGARKVDAISGATWSYNIFTAALEVALKKAWPLEVN